MIKKLLTLLSLAAGTISFGQTISAGGGHSLFLCSGNTVKSCGSNASGQLGTGDKVQKTLPEPITGLTAITAASAGKDHSLFLKNDGTVWVTGSNNKGQLGFSTPILLTPAPIAGLSGITAVSAGAYYSLFLKNDGTVWATGMNSSGQLGIGNTTDQSTSVQIPGLSSITAISAGNEYSLFLKSDGTVWATGNNAFEQLGIGNTTNQSTPVQIPNLVNITAISSGAYHSLFLKNDGTVWATGANDSGQLGIGSTTNQSTPVQIPGLSSITVIEAGDECSLFLKNDGTVWATGANKSGQLGLGTTTRQSTPVQIPGLNNITAVSSGTVHSLFLKNDGTVYATGYNYSGPLGTGNTTTQKTPQQLALVCVPPTAPQATISVPNNAVCQGSNVTIGATIVGSNPGVNMILDNSIALNNPIAIDKNSHAVFVLTNNNSVTAYNFDGTVYNTYPNLTLTNIWAFTVDENDNLYINNGSVDGSGYLQIHKCNNTGALVTSIPNAYLDASNLVTDLLYYNHPGALENIFYSDSSNGAAAINATNMNDNNAISNSISFNMYNKKYTSISMDNFYADKRLLMADPINEVLAYAPMFNNQGLDADTLVDHATTAGMALDYIYADTALSAALSLPGSSILVSSRTTGTIGLVNSYRNPDGTINTYFDTTLTSYFNAIAPVGGVLVRHGNQLEYWVADNGQNKLLRLSLSSYSINPALPAGLLFNSVTGAIEGTPTAVTPSQIYTLTIFAAFGFSNSTSTFTLGVTPSSGVSNTIGTTSSSTTQTDGTTKNYIDQQNCTQLVVITDFAGGTSPGLTTVEQTVSATGDVTVGNARFVRRVTKIEAEQTENINANLVFYYTYQDVQAYNAANPTNTFTNDTTAGSMQMYILHMHEKLDSLRGWIKEPTHYGPITALWIPNKHVWETSLNVNKLSEFYAGPSAIDATFNCSNSGKDTVVANDFYVWNYPDSLFASGDYVDTLTNQTGCDSIVQLHLTINTTTGLNQAALTSGISVFPNPSTGVFIIRFNSAAVTASKVRVISVIGTELMSKTITSSDQIDLSAYQSGIYYLSIENEGTTKTWRIVKQ